MFISFYLVFEVNLSFSFFLALIVYCRSKKYYRPLLRKDKDGNIINLHEKYDPFHPHDNICFLQLWFGAFFCAFIKLLSSFFIVIVLNFHMKIISECYRDYNTNTKSRKKIRDAITFWSSMFLVMNGIWIRKRNLEYDNVYKKYLGKDYNFTDDRYSIILSNHMGFFDIVLCMRLFAPSFIAKLPVKNFCFVGSISQRLNCLFVNRINKENKAKIFDELLQRQKSFYEGNLYTPIVIFPEGTCSCCRNILRFKKGAFYALLPVKPMIIKINQRSSFHLSVGASNVVLHYFKNLCHFINSIDYTILPTVRPVNYLFEHYKNLGKEKWQIYANVVRKIYSEVGGFVEVNMGLRDLNRYIKAMRTGFYDPNENFDYEQTKGSTEGFSNNFNIELNSNKHLDIIENKNDNEISKKCDKNKILIDVKDNEKLEPKDQEKDKYKDKNVIIIKENLDEKSAYKNEKEDKGDNDEDILDENSKIKLKKNY